MKYIPRLFLLFGFVAFFIAFVAYARGYRIDIQNKSLSSTGIIAITSKPNAAKVYVNGVLKGVTDMSMTLPPGNYTIEVKKEGFRGWKKTLKLKGELVMSEDAYLFPLNASLTPITNIGVGKVIAIDQTGKLLIFSQTGDVEKDGIYVFDQSKRPFSLFPPLKLLVLKKNLPPDIDLLKTTVTFSPDFKEGIFSFSTENEEVVAYDMGFDEEITSPFDVTVSQTALKAAWEEERAKEIAKILETLPKLLQPIASDSFHLVSFAPDKTKFLYMVKKSVSLPLVITPALISANQAAEERALIPNRLYVYDIKEDKNFRLDVKVEDFVDEKDFENWGPFGIENYVMWYPNSRHLLLNEKKQISIMEYDNTNKQVLYSGPHEQQFLDVWTDGKLIILVNLNPLTNSFPDIYQVGIR